MALFAHFLAVFQLYNYAIDLKSLHSQLGTVSAAEPKNQHRSSASFSRKLSNGETEKEKENEKEKNC
jgi:hypothetical protein